VIEAVLEPLLPTMPDGYRVLEVGCGTGNTLRVLERVCTGGTVIGMDLFDEGPGLPGRGYPASSCRAASPTFRWLVIST
jgi:SAM-dependent methyltransferase